MVPTGRLEQCTVLTGRLEWCTLLTGHPKQCLVLTGRLERCTLLTGHLEWCTVLTDHSEQCMVLTGHLERCTVLTGHLEQMNTCLVPGLSYLSRQIVTDNWFHIVLTHQEPGTMGKVSARMRESFGYSQAPIRSPFYINKQTTEIMELNNAI